MNVAENIYVDLRARLLTGLLSPGCVLDVASAVQFYGCSRSTITSPLRALCVEGYLSVDHRGRYLAAMWNPQSVDDYFDIGPELLVISLRKLVRIWGPARSTRIASRLSAIGGPPACASSSIEPLTSDIIAGLSAIPRESGIGNLEDAFGSLFPISVRRAALFHMDVDGREEARSQIACVGSSIANGDLARAEVAVRTLLSTMRAAVISKCDHYSRTESQPIYVFGGLYSESDAGAESGGLEVQDLEAWLEEETAMNDDRARNGLSA